MADGTWPGWGWAVGWRGCLSWGLAGFVLQRARWQCEAILRGEQGHPWGRFGAALTVLGDVNGDKLTDIAIGAPGEQENQGAVYLFHGTSGLGVSPSHSQVRRCHCLSRQPPPCVPLSSTLPPGKLAVILSYLLCPPLAKAGSKICGI